MNRETLTRPFDAAQLKQRPGQNGRVITYVETHVVIQRLNDGCDAWSFEILEHRILEEEIVVIGKLTADGVVKSTFGGSAVTRDATGRALSIADDAKAAASDALKKAASLLGVGLELYGAAKARPLDIGGGRPQAPSKQQEQSALPPAERLTQRQLGTIYSAARRRNLSKASLADFVRNRTGRGQAELLSKRQASDIIAELTSANGHG